LSQSVTRVMPTTGAVEAPPATQPRVGRAGTTALPWALVVLLRRHLVRHPEEKWRRTSDGRVRCTCSCGNRLVLEVGAHRCATPDCDRVWIWTGRSLSHAHPDQIA
jgi:hypothetical protein